MGPDYSKGTSQFGDCRRAAFSFASGTGRVNGPVTKLCLALRKGLERGGRGDGRNVTRKVFRETTGKSPVNLKVPPCLKRVDNLLINLGIIKPPVLSLWIQLYSREPNSRHSIKLVKSSAYLLASRSFLFFFFLFFYTIWFTRDREYAIINLISLHARGKKTGKIVIPLFSSGNTYSEIGRQSSNYTRQIDTI